jgi:hypothetical protein
MDVLDMHQRGGGKRSWKVKLPDEECEDCTLQVIQVMLDKLPYDPQDNGALSNDIYYACLDVVLKRKGAAASDAAVADASEQPAPRDAGPPAMADAGDEPAPSGEEPAMTPRDAGIGKRDASRSPPPSRDAAVDEDGEHAGHEDGDGEQHDDAGGDGEMSDGADEPRSSSDEGCALSAERSSSGGALALGLLALALRSLRRRRSSPG